MKKDMDITVFDSTALPQKMFCLAAKHKAYQLLTGQHDEMKSS
jgi:hypothetical protein